jgi:hypothetical protein
MAEIKALGDPAEYPGDEVLARHLGRAGPAYAALIESDASSRPAFGRTWKYYHDGKSWLQNVSSKKKTVYWLSVEEGAFRITFYLPSSAEAAVGSSGLPEAVKDRFRATAGKKFRALTLEIKSLKDLEAYAEAVAIKLGA